MSTVFHSFNHIPLPCIFATNYFASLKINMHTIREKHMAMAYSIALAIPKGVGIMTTGDGYGNP